MNQRVLAWLLAGVCVLSATLAGSQRAPAPPGREPTVPIDYNRDVLPILARSCFTCHGPDSGSRKAGLRLDLREDAIKPARSRDVPIVPGKSADSEAVRRIFTSELSDRMPPVKGGKPLSEREKEIIKRWIDEGAEYKLHWAFIPPARPLVPPVKNKAWVKNEIDAFILARLEKEGLAPSPRADRATLIRRLSLDLRGLPPSLDEVDAYLADDSMDAYEKLVDRMLASPHFGEKMAQTWLDLARFGDTSGYHRDSSRQMWLWRDWVIDAFNSNMPFDQFTIEQLAGDLLAPASGGRKPPDADVPHAALGQHHGAYAPRSPIIASGFNRNTRFNEEGGVDPEEYVIRYTIDRTNTLGQVWLGLTLACAECHSHKYDPISHKEYYQLFAYFTGIAEPMKSGNHDQALPPLLKVPAPEQVKELAEHRQAVARLEQVIAKELARFDYKDPLEGKEETPTDRYRQSQAAWEFKEWTNLKLPKEIQDALEVERAERTVEQKKRLREYYLRKVHDRTRELIGLLDDDVVELTKKIKQLEDAIPHTLISEEMPTPRPAFVLLRGDFQNKGERVERAVPVIFPPVPDGAPANRLGLARWLVHPEHPLTARVQVNRLWAQMFGAGLVRTLADFGSQGEHPSHPELLDWLAIEFMASRDPKRPEDRISWDVKHMLRTIALSATYQQSSRQRGPVVDAPGSSLDPDNRLLHRAPRYRISAEETRDSALAIAGLLNPKIGGPSFMPYQPADFYKGRNEEWPWKTSQGDDQYRRGLYAFWRRNALHPMFAILDAPTREECASSRPRTNTPLQALVTLNDPTFVEAARVFAQKVLTQAPKDHDARLRYVFRSATCRPPSDAELRVLRHRFQQQRDRFAADEDAASKLVNVGQHPRDARLDVVELATWTAICNMVLNLDEVLTRE